MSERPRRIRGNKLEERESDGDGKGRKRRREGLDEGGDGFDEIEWETELLNIEWERERGGRENALFLCCLGMKSL